MKRLMVSVALSVCTMLSWAQFSGSGSGTESDPYLIFYADQLNQVRNFLNQEGVYFKLMSNLNLTTWLNGNNPSLGWEPIGTSAAPFKGVFDGNGKKLSGFSIKRSSAAYIGFFGATDGATIKNLIINGDVSGGQYTGAFVGYATGSTLDGLTLQGTVNGAESTGGIVGYAKSSTISNTRTSNTINGSADCVGGICGTAEDTSFSNCYSYSDVHGQNRVGGIVGKNTGETPNETALPTRIINNCLASVNITGASYVGGIVGEFTHTLASYSFSSNNWTRTNYYEMYHVSNCIAMGNITASGSCTGGIAGFFLSGGHKDYIYYRVKHIRDSFFTGNIVGTQSVGGICGELQSYGGVMRNYVRASIQGTIDVGGIIGKTSKYSAAKKYDPCPDIKSNIALNTVVAGTSNVGRIYGTAEDGTTIGENGNAAEDNRALYDTRISLNGVTQEIQDDAQNGVSNGDAYFKLKANYVGHGWDFNTDWTNQETETYPYKTWQAAPPTITSALVSGATSISGQSIDGGTVYVKIGNGDYVSVTCSGTSWTLSGLSPLQSGATILAYAMADGKEASYLTQESVSYPGSGTDADPWLIYTAYDLQGVYKSGHYKQMNDIDLTTWINENSSTAGWIAVGRAGSGQIVYDGGGYKVTGLWTNTTDEYTGLFSNFDNGTIRNLNIEIANKQVKGGNNTGALIGRITNGLVENVTVTGNAQGGPVVGGVIGNTQNTTLKHVIFNGKVISAIEDAYIGGVVGQAGEGTVISNSSSSATVTATGSGVQAGGLIGHSDATVRCSYSTGSVSGMATDSYIGGLVGQTDANSVIENCYSTSNVTSTLYAAGLVAYNFGTINNSYASGNVTSTYYGAGVVGYNDGTSALLTNSVALGARIEVSDQTGWGIRVLGGIKNNAPVPDESNYGWSGMQISVNGIPKIVEDNILDGQSLTDEEIISQDTYETLSWDFDDIWTFVVGRDYPILKWETETTPTTALTLNMTSLTLEIGGTAELTVTVVPFDASQNLIWSSSNTGVVTIDNNGFVNALAIGTATITVAATDGTGITATSQVTVTASKSEAIANLRSLVAEAQALYDNSVEGDIPGLYQIGSRAELLAVIHSVNSRISDDMSFEDINDCTADINAAIETFNSKIVSAGEDTDISQIDNVVYVECIEALAGTEQTLSIKMKNIDDIQTVQFDLYLPDGVEVVLDDDDYELIELSLDRTTARKMDQFSVVRTSNGAYRVLINSTRGNTFDGNDGEIVTARVKLADDMAAGDYPLIFKDIVLVNNSSVGYRTAYVKSTLSVDDYIPGDVNNDKAVDAIDLNAITNYILERRTFPFTFNVKAGDVNGDSVIDAIDLNAVTNMILHDSQAGAKPRAVVVGRIDNE